MSEKIKINDLQVNMPVKIINSKDIEVEGIIVKILTHKENSKGVKVILDNGAKGRVIEILKEYSKERFVNENKNIEKEINGNQNKPIVIDINDTIENSSDELLFSKIKQVNYRITSKIFRSMYCNLLKSDIYGIVIFKVRAMNIPIAVYKINLFIKRNCITTDLKYEIIKTDIE